MTARPACSVYIAMSVDGYIAGADHSLDWLKAVEAEGEDYGYAAFYGTVDALVIGRGTYDKVLTFGNWPYGGKRCVVMTHRAATAIANEEFYSGSPSALIEKLASAGAKRVYVDGGAVIRAFLKEGLIDDLTLSIIPVVLGDGIRLFDSGLPERALKLTDVASFPSGLVQLHYRVGA